jgi:hypothetical protein
MRSAPVHAHALRWRGRRRALGPHVVGVQLLLSLLLLLPLLLVLFGAGGNFVVGGRLVVSGNIDSEFPLRVRNIV